MSRRTKNSQDVSLVDMPDVTPGVWVYEPGDDGDSSVGIGPYGPTVSVAIPDDPDTFVELALVREPVYSVLPARTPDGEFDYDTGERYLPGNLDRNGLLMAGSKGLLEACQAVLKGLYDERDSKPTAVDPYSDRPACLLGQIEVLETAIRAAIVFPG